MADEDEIVRAKDAMGKNETTLGAMYMGVPL
jgi:hypothetical protein